MNIRIDLFYGKTIILGLIVLLSLSFLGCTMVGQVIPVDNRLLLVEKEYSHGMFSRGGLTVDYGYRLVGAKMSLEGQVYYRRGVDSLDVHLLFLDAEGTVLQQKLVYFSGYRLSRSWLTDRSFKKELVVPPGAVGISFNYNAVPRSNQR